MSAAVFSGWWSAYPARSRPSTFHERFTVPALAAVGAFLLWWAVTAAGWVMPSVLPSPIDVVLRLGGWLVDGTLWRYLAPTVGVAVWGGLLAAGVALPLGILTAHSKSLAAIVEPLVALSQTVPLVAIAPLLVIWLGYGAVPIAVLCAIISFFPMITTTLVGLRGLDSTMVEQAALDGAGWVRRLWHVELPVAAPSILAGLRGGVVLSMTGAVVGELVIGGSGMGTLLTLTRESADVTGTFTVVVAISVVALALHALVLLAERASVRRIEENR